MTVKTQDEIVELHRTEAHQLVARNAFGRNSRYDIITHNLLQPNPRAALAERLLSHFGIIAAQEGGEDSAGRQALKLMEPWEVVDRSCIIADRFWSEIEARGWVDRMPTMQEISEKYRANETEE